LGKQAVVNENGTVRTHSTLGVYQGSDDNVAGDERRRRLLVGTGVGDTDIAECTLDAREVYVDQSAWFSQAENCEVARLRGPRKLIRLLLAASGQV